MRGLDNMIGEEGAVTRTFTQELKCVANTTGATETQLLNVTVKMAKSSPTLAALEPPSSIAVGCLVEDVETRVLANFSAPNASVAYRALTAAWQIGDALPWVSSGPWSATRFSAHSKKKFDAASQFILRSLNVGTDGRSLELVLKPPGGQAGLRGVRDASWKVCIVPGDGYNYYAELCTETFPVRQSKAECDMSTTPPPTSDSALLHSSVALPLAFLAALLFTSLW